MIAHSTKSPDRLGRGITNDCASLNTTPPLTTLVDCVEPCCLAIELAVLDEELDEVFQARTKPVTPEREMQGLKTVWRLMLQTRQNMGERTPVCMYM